MKTLKKFEELKYSKTPLEYDAQKELDDIEQENKKINEYEQAEELMKNKYDIDKLKKLIEVDKYDVNSKGNAGFSILSDIVYDINFSKKNLITLKYLLNLPNIEIDSESQYGSTPLQLAISSIKRFDHKNRFDYKLKLEAIDLLLKYGADPYHRKHKIIPWYPELTEKNKGENSFELAVIHDNYSGGTHDDKILKLLNKYKKTDEDEYISFEKELLGENMKNRNIKTFNQFNESTGDYEDSFIDINIDETELEDSDRPNLGKLKQKSGTSIIETPSKTDAYNAKMRLGGDVIVDPKNPDKQIHHVKNVKESLINDLSPEVKKEIEDLGIKIEGGLNGNLVTLIFRSGTGQIRFLIDKNGQFYKHGAELYATSTSQLGPQEKQNLQTAINKIKAHFQTV